jgi:hypothetical protein
VTWRKFQGECPKFWSDLWTSWLFLLGANYMIHIFCI